jgi:hypothetical protein
MNWNEVPDGVSLSMSKQDAMDLRGSRKGPFIAGVICGAVLLIGLQSCGSDDGNKPKTGASQSANPSNKN